MLNGIGAPDEGRIQSDQGETFSCNEEGGCASARLGSDRLGSARLGSAGLGSARLGSTRGHEATHPLPT